MKDYSLRIYLFQALVLFFLNIFYFHFRVFLMYKESWIENYKICI